jgi:hypothetical protein
LHKQTDPIVVRDTTRLSLYRLARALVASRWNTDDCIGIPAAARVLYFFVGVLLSPFLAAAAMVVSSLAAVQGTCRAGELYCQAW